MNGFQVLCEDFIRFTHAFTTSTLAVPALGSLMTGKLPLDIDLHDNASFLKRSSTTVVETAHNKGYRTSFFSGGAPVFRKTGLAQGFEYFDDHFRLSHDKLFRPVRENTGRFLRWLDRINASESFLSIIYASDLKFQSHQTTSTSGELRSQNIESQIEEVSEVLGDLFQKLRGRGRWNNTLIIVTGLSGRPQALHEFSKNKLPPPLQLHSHDMQVVLFIKPPSQARDEVTTWKVDRNMSLIDLAPTIEEIIQQPQSPKTVTEQTPKSLSSSRSLVPLLFNLPQNFLDGRIIVLESGWANWHYQLPIRTALLQHEYLFFYDERPSIFNTFVDHLELFPMRGSDIDGSSIYDDFLNFAKQQQLRSFPTTRFFQLSANLEAIPYSAWVNSTSDPELKSTIQTILKKETNKEALEWSFRLALERRDWVELESLARKHKDDGALYTALVNQRKTSDLPKEPCLQHITNPPEDLSATKNCSDILIHTLFYFMVDTSQTHMDKDSARKRVESLIYDLYLNSRITHTNYALGRVWDLSPINQVRPLLVEYALHLPQLNRLRIQALNSMFTQTQETSAE